MATKMPECEESVIIPGIWKCELPKGHSGVHSTVVQDWKTIAENLANALKNLRAKFPESSYESATVELEIAHIAYKEWEAAGRPLTGGG